VRAALAAGAVLLVAGCGGNVDERSAAAEERVVLTEAAPPITAIDGPAPEGVEWSLKAELSSPDTTNDDTSSDGVHFYLDCGVSVPMDDSEGTQSHEFTECPPPTPEEIEEGRRIEEQWRKAIEPAPGTRPRSVASLSLSDGGRALFVLWRNLAGELCTQTEIEDAEGVGSGGAPSGPCLPKALGCDEVCVDSQGGGPGYVLTGLVPADGEAARVTLAGGATRTFPLQGPIVRGTERRVLMMELGERNWRKLEVIRAGNVMATAEMPAFMAVAEDCQAQAEPFPTFEDDVLDDEAFREWSDGVSSCIRTRLPLGWEGSFEVRSPLTPARP